MPGPSHDDEPGLTRRRLLRTALTAAGAVAIGSAASHRSAARAASAPTPLRDGLTVWPRATWAADLAPTGTLDSEAPGDVRFLLVHHTASGNDYSAADVPELLRGFFGFHTGPERGFPDLAYNFLIDRYGGVWEGREGSLAGPVKPSATGGSQGYAMLGCYIGDFTAEVPTAEARASMLALLAWLADTYDVDTSPGSEVTFTSRGSSRWPAGASVTTPTIAGHRDMSLTSCPGDAAYADLQATYAAEVTALRTAAVPSVAPTAAVTTPPAASPTTQAPSPTRTPRPTRTSGAATPTPVRTDASPVPDDDSTVTPWVAAAAAGTAAVTVAGAVVAQRRRAAGQHEPGAS